MMWTFLLVLMILILLWALAVAPRTRRSGVRTYRPTNGPDPLPRRGEEQNLTPLRDHYYAHRGYYKKDQSIPENSLPAFARAVENHFGVELDVHLTKDGKLAVLHDENLKRMCGADVTLSELSAAELKQYRLKGTENTIPLFQEVLKVIDGKVPMVIEVKPYGGNIGAICERLCEELEGYRGVFCVESFDPRAVIWFRKHRPDLVRGQLAMKWSRYGKDAGPLSAFAVANLLLNILSRPDFVAYCVEDRSNWSFQLCRMLYGVQEFAWTVRSPEQAAEVERDGGLLIFEYFDPRTESEAAAD